MRVLVVGGGIAGTAVALALRQAGSEVVVCEANPVASEEAGAFLTVASNGMLALVQLGVAEQVAAAGFALTSMRVRDDRDAEVAAPPLDDAGDPVTRYRCLYRRDLVEVMRAAASASGVELRYGTRLVAADESAELVRGRFADGTAVDADLLVGADGLWSTVRGLLDPDAARPRYAGQRVFYGYADGVDAGTPHQFDAYPGSGAYAFGLFRAPNGRVFWFARINGPPLPAGELAVTDPAHWREWLRPLVPAGVPERVVRAAGEHVLATDARDLPSVRHWRGRRTVLIGDAAHAASPASGQGASMAFEDAVVLGKALRDLPSPEAALAGYERLRRRRVEDNVAASAAMTGSPVHATAERSTEAERDADVDLPTLLNWATPLPANDSPDP